MIFVTVGSRGYPFERLIKEVDRISLEGRIFDHFVVAQIGSSTFTPKNIEFTDYMDKKKYDEYVAKADIIITHGGTGAIISALKKEKQVVAFPRLKIYGEHIDDHQIQICEVLEAEGYIKVAKTTDDILNCLSVLIATPITKKYISESRIISIIGDFLG